MKDYLQLHAQRLLAAFIAVALLGFGLAPDPATASMLLAAPFLVGDTDLGKLKELLDNQGRAWEEFRKTNDELLKAKAEGKAVADLEAKLTKINTELDRMGELKTQLDGIQAKLNRPGGGDKETENIEAETKSFNLYRKSAASGAGHPLQDLSVDEYRHYKSGFWKLTRRGSLDMLEPDERKAMQAGVDSDGGYLLPTPTVGRIVSRIHELSPIRAIANVQTISTDALEGINDLDEADAGWVTETGDRNDTDTPQVGKYRIEAQEMYAQPKATQKLLDDAAVDIEAWLAGKVASKMARVEGAGFCVGSGIGQAKGIASYPTAASDDGSRAWGTLEHVNTGANGAFHTTQADPLFDLIGAFKSAYLQNARWVTIRAVITAIRKFKTTNTSEYIWQPGLQAGQPDRLLGYPIVIAQDMPALATGSLSMAFGDFMEGYQIVDRIGIRTLRDPYTSKPYVKFYSTRRVGGGVVNFDAIKFIRFAAS